MRILSNLASTFRGMSQLPVEIIRSSRRKRTLQATVTDGVIRVRVPEGLAATEERRLVDSLVQKVRRKMESNEVDLTARAQALAQRFNLPTPDTISWSSRQNTRWGSCTPATRSVRISDKLVAVPGFVLDYVIVHELCHLDERGHGAAFKTLMDRYPLAERATGYLMALGFHGSSAIEPPPHIDAMRRD